jgi:hypothetical protein
MTEQKAPYTTDQLFVTGGSAEFDRQYLAELLIIERSHCAKIEKQLDALRDAARQLVNNAMTAQYMTDAALVFTDHLARLQAELLKE